MKEEEPLAQQPLLEKNKPVINSGPVKSIERYKKRLLAQVVTIFLICLTVILERVFYSVIVEAEDQTLASLQLNAGLVKQNSAHEIVPKSITDGFLTFFGALSHFEFQFLFLTHVLTTIYVAYDALLASKVAYVSLGLIYLVSVIQMFYQGPRPFWYGEKVLTSSCLSAFNHPSLGLILMIFVPMYTYQCWRKKPNSSVGESIPKKHKICAGILVTGSLAIQFVNYLLGTMYLINIAMSLVIGTLLLMVAFTANPLIDKAIKKSTVLKTDAKKYIFYWLLLICLLATFVLIIFSGEDLFLNIDWVENYMSCTRYQGYPDRTYRYDEIIGPWFNFTQTATLFGWIGAVFGISSCFRKMPNIEWAGGNNTGKRVARALIANLFILPSWVFVIFVQDKGNWVKNIGLNDFIVDAVHFFVLYLWIFGYMPILILHRALKLVNREEEDFYVIVENTNI